MTNPTPKRRWYRLTPDRFFWGLLVVQVFLLLSERFQWFAFNEKKGWTVLIAVGVVCVAVAVMLVWFLVNLLPRRRFQFSFRWLLFFLVVVSIPLCWFAMKMQKARRQREARETILELGGYIIYDYEFDETGERIWEAEPTTPAWLRKWLGDDFFCDVTRVGCLSTHFTDAELEHLKGLTNLKSLRLKDTQVTDAGLEHLKGLTSLEELWLLNTQATEEGVKKLQVALPDCGIIHGSASAYGGKERAMRHVGQPGWRFLLDRVGNKK